MAKEIPYEQEYYNRRKPKKDVLFEMQMHAVRKQKELKTIQQEISQIEIEINDYKRQNKLA